MVVMSTVDHSLVWEWLSDGLERAGVLCRYVLLNPEDGPYETFLRDRGIPVTRVHYESKRDAPRALAHLTALMALERPRVVHAHLFDASVLAMIAARVARVPSRIHTRHYSRLQQVYHPNGVKYDRLASAMSTRVVAISDVVADAVVDEGTAREKIRVIHHGFDVDRFRDVPEARVRALRDKYDLPADRTIVGVVSRYIALKGLDYIIPAFGAFLRHDPKALLVLANAAGEEHARVQQLLAQHCPGAHRQIVFETDGPALYKTFDYFIHAPVDSTCEAFGQTYVEALLAGVPSVFALSGVANELVRHEHNALVVPHRDAAAITAALVRLATDDALRQRIVANGMADARNGFTVDRMVSGHVALYAEAGVRSIADG